MKMDSKNETTWFGRALRWTLKFILKAIPAAWIVWAIHLACHMNVEIAQTGNAEWDTLIELFIVTFFGLGFIKNYMKHDFDDYDR